MPNTPIATQTLADALHWRYATKKFDPARKIPDATWAALEQALVLSPSSYGLQPWKFIVVRDKAARAKLSAASYGQKQSIECSHFVVFSMRKNVDTAFIERFVARIAEVRGGPADKLKVYGDTIIGSADQARKNGYLDTWMSRQVYIALGGFMTAAALLGVDTCPMEGIEAPKFDEVLGLAAQGYATLCACAAGYRAVDDAYAGQAKVRFETQDVVTHV